MTTRRTACGWYLPSSSACFTLGQCDCNQSFSWPLVRSCTPAAPRFRTTRSYACTILLRATTRSMSAPSSDFVRSTAAVQISAPESGTSGFCPPPRLWLSHRSSLPSRSASRFGRPTLGVSCSGLRCRHLLCPLLTSGPASRNCLGDGSLSAPIQISPGIARVPSRLCASDLQHCVPDTYRALHSWACSPRSDASIRFLFVAPALCFRLPSDPSRPGNPRLPLTLPRVGCVVDFHHRVRAPCRAHEKKRPAAIGRSLTNNEQSETIVRNSGGFEASRKLEASKSS
jgi:hypothetical protein